MSLYFGPPAVENFMVSGLKEILPENKDISGIVGDWQIASKRTDGTFDIFGDWSTDGVTCRDKHISISEDEYNLLKARARKVYDKRSGT